MEDGILDAERKKRKPVPVVKTGLVFGAISLLLTAAIIYSSYLLFSEREDKGGGYAAVAFSLGILAPLLLSMIMIAAWGPRKYHFFKILGNGLICYNTMLTGFIAYGYIGYLIKNPNKEFLDDKLLKGMGMGEISILILAFIFWLIPGKLPYFRKQIEP